MKKRTILLLAAVMCAICLLACGCSSHAGTITGAQSAAAKKLTTFKCSATVTDGDTVVYVYANTVSVSGDTASITTTEQTLNESFVLEEKNSSKDVALDRALFRPLVISDGDISDYKQEGDVISCKVKKESLAVVLGAEVSAATDAVLTAEMSNGDLTLLTITFTTQTGKSVTIGYTYNY